MADNDVWFQGSFSYHGIFGASEQVPRGSAAGITGWLRGSLQPPTSPGVGRLERTPLDPLLHWNYFALQANLVSRTNGKNEQTGAGAQLTGPRCGAPGQQARPGPEPRRRAPRLKIAEDIFQNGMSKSTVSPAE